MLAFLFSVLLVWNGVLTFFLIRDWRLLMRVLRWTATIWLVAFGLLASGVLREGLVVNGDTALHWDVRLAWTAWFVLVGCSVLDWRFLPPAVVLPIWLFSHPEVCLLLDYGLVRLRWLRPVHGSVAWVTSDLTTLFAWAFRTHATFDCLVARILIPATRPVNNLIDHATSWLVQISEPSLDKLQPPLRWAWLPVVGR